jgi:hypothetical protein
MNRPENKDLKAYADFLIDEFYVDLKSEYEPTYIHITNTKFPEGTYYPLFSTTTDGDFHEQQSLLDDKGNMNYKSAMAGNLKQRVKHENPLDYNRDAYEVALNYIATMERAKQMIPLGETVNSVFNQSTNPELINLIGTKNLNDLQNHLTRVITGQDPRKTTLERSVNTINAIQGIRVFTSLAFKLASVPKQVTSMFRFTSGDVSVSDWIRGFAPMTKNEREVMARVFSSDYVKERFSGSDIDPAISRLLKPGARGRRARALSKAAKAGMLTTTVGDIGGVLTGGIPYTVAQYRKNIAKGMDHEAAYQDAYEKFTRISDETQQSTAESELSGMQKDNVGRLFTAFTTSQTQGLNKIVNSTRKLMNAKKSGLSKDEMNKHAYNILFYLGENMFFGAVASNFLKKLVTSELFEDEEEGKKSVYNLVADNIQSLLSGMGYEGVAANFIISKLRGDAWKNTVPVVQQLNAIAGAGESLFTYTTNGAEWDELTDAQKKNAIKILPINQLVNTITNITEVATDKDSDKDFIDAVMNYRTKEEEAQYRKKDLIYEQIFDKPRKKDL